MGCVSGRHRFVPLRASGGGFLMPYCATGTNSYVLNDIKSYPPLRTFFSQLSLYFTLA